MAITSNCAEIIITNPQGSVSFNKLITTTELSPAKTVDSEDRVYLIQNSENVPQTFWWNLEKAIADGYADLEELYDYFVAEIANQCGGGGGGSSYIPPFLKTGGASWSGTGLVYDVTALEYYFNGDKNTSATQVTLDASDPIDNRLDAIVVDEAGVVSVIKGDASASPISPSVDESHILVQYILVEAGTTEPTIVKEDIYLENAEWTTSTYTTGTATGSIDFDNAVSPKQGVKCISANADARLGARFVRTTSFDPYQYTMLSMWVRFTGSNVATNKSLNVRFENGAGALVANTINLFNFGLQGNLLNVWQLVVIPITSFGALPTSVKGLKIIMTGGTVGQARQWDIDLISLTDNSVPAINEQVFNVLKDGALVGQSSSLNFKGGAVNVTKDVIGGKIDVEVITQTLAISGNDLSISGGNTVVLPPDTTQVSVSKNGTLVGITDKLNFVAGTNTTVDVDNILGVYRIKFNNSSLQSLQAGAGIGIDITNPLSPIVYALQKMQIALTDRSNNIVANTIVHEFIVLENFEITSSPFISLVTAPTGANFILQIQKNGVEVGINTKALVVTAGTNVSTATTDFNGVTFAKGDRISFRVTQIGSVNAGKGLDILLNFKN